jgi:hypothetical protein
MPIDGIGDGFHKRIGKVGANISAASDESPAPEWERRDGFAGSAIQALQARSGHE